MFEDRRKIFIEKLAWWFCYPILVTGFRRKMQSSVMGSVNRVPSDFCKVIP